jgi:hypothetical protein
VPIKIDRLAKEGVEPLIDVGIHPRARDILIMDKSLDRLPTSW